MPIGPPLAFTDYRPSPDGQGTMFRQPDGREFMSFGPDADALRRQIDENRPPDQRLAFDEAAPFGTAASVPDTGPAPLVSPPEAQQEPIRRGVTVEGPQKGPAPAPQGGDIPPPPADLQEPAGAPAAAPAPAGPQVAQMPELGGTVRFAGRDPARDAARAVAVPTTSTVSSEGGIQDPADREAARASFAARGAAQEEIARVEEQGAQLRLAQNAQAIADAKLRAATLEQEATKIQTQQSLIRQEHAKQMQTAQASYDAASADKVDEYRIFSGKPGAQIAAMIGVALGGMASVLTGKENPALQVIQQRIATDIANQREEIQRRGAKTQNDMTRLRDRYGVDHDDAENMLKLNYSKQVENNAIRRAAAEGTPAAMQQLAMIRPQLAKWQADAADALRASLAGKVTATESSKMVTPTSGGVRQKTLKEQAEDAGYYAKIATAQNVYGHGGVLTKGSDPNKPEGEITQDLARANVATEGALPLLHELKRESAKLGRFGNTLDKLKQGGGDTKWNALVDHAATAIATMELGGNQASEERVEHLKSVLNASNPAEREAHIESLLEVAQGKYRSIRSTSSAVGKVGDISAPAKGEE